MFNNFDELKGHFKDWAEENPHRFSQGSRHAEIKCPNGLIVSIAQSFDLDGEPQTHCAKGNANNPEGTFEIVIFGENCDTNGRALLLAQGCTGEQAERLLKEGIGWGSNAGWLQPNEVVAITNNAMALGL